MVVERFVAWAASVSSEERAEAIRDIALMVIDANVSGEDRDNGIKILTLFLTDPNPQVRAAMAEELAETELAPRSLVWSLANDIPEIAAIVYQLSPHFDEAALSSAIGNAATQVVEAISMRADLTPKLVRDIAAKADGDAVACMLRNPMIKLGPGLLEDIANRLGDHATVRSILLERDDLAAETSQLLVRGLSKALYDLADEKGWADESRLQQVTSDAANRATIDMTFELDADGIDRYATHLAKTGQITSATLLRAICSGNAVFFECALSKLTGASLRRVQSIMDEGRESAFRSLYKKSGLPIEALPVFNEAISVWQEFDACGSTQSLSQVALGEAAINAILDNLSAEAGLANPALLTLLRQMATEAAHDSATIGFQEAA